MPELPEVETIRTGLDIELTGKRIDEVICYRPNLRYPFPEQLENTLIGQHIRAIRRRAKYLLIDVGEHTLIAHLGMSGTYVIRPQDSIERRKHDHMVWTIADGRELVYHDPRRFGFLLMTAYATWEEHEMIRNLGIEPLSDALNAESLAQKLHNRTQAIKQFLLDQRHIVGIGNIYASEALFRSGIHPQRPAGDCIADAQSLADTIKLVLQEAINSGGSTLRNYASASGDTGYFQHKFHVYGRTDAPCVRCDTPIKKITQGGRSTFFCPSCQPS